MQYAAKNLGFKDSFEILYTISEDPAFTTFSKTFGQKGRAYAEMFDATLKELKKEGVIEKIMDNYR